MARRPLERPLWLLRAQLACVYFFAGIAKLNSDCSEERPHFFGRRDSGVAQDFSRVLQLMPERNNEIVP